jgi:hypothetical protein
MATFVSPFTGNVIQPTDVSYLDLAVASGSTTQLSWPANTVSGGDTEPAARIIDITGDGSGTIILPPASQGSVGSDILFNNLSVGAVTIELFDQPVASTTIASGESWYFYLVDDDDTNVNAWHTFAFGASTVNADALSLAGYGLQAQEGKLNTSTLVNELYTDYQLVSTDRSRAYVWKAGLGEVYLPIEPPTAGWYVMLRNEGEGQVTVYAPYLKTINGFATQVFFPTDSAIITYDVNTGNYYTIGLPRTTLVPYSSAIYDVDSLPGNTLNLVNAAVTIQTYVANTGSRTQSLDVTLPAITQIYVITNQTNQVGYSVTFNVVGSPDAPVIINTGTVAILLTYGLKTQILYGNNNLLQVDGGNF